MTNETTSMLNPVRGGGRDRTQAKAEADQTAKSGSAGQWSTIGVRSNSHRMQIVQRFQAQLRDPCASEDIFQMSPY